MKIRLKNKHIQRLFEDEVKSDEYYIEKAREMAKNDWAMAEWIRIYDKGIHLKFHQGNRKYKYYDIPPKSDFALRNIKKAVRLREEGVIFTRR